MFQIDRENEYRLVAGFEAIVLILSVVLATPSKLPFELLATVSIGYGFGISILVLESLVSEGFVKGKFSHDQWGFSVLILSTASTLLTKNAMLFVFVLIINLIWLGYRYKSSPSPHSRSLLPVSPMFGGLSLQVEGKLQRVVLIAIRQRLIEILSYLIAIIMVSFLALAPEYSLLLKGSGCLLAAFRLVLVAANKQKSPSSLN